MARYVGQSSDIAVALPDGDAAAVLAALPELFAAEHDRTYGFRAPPGEPIEMTAVSVIAVGIPERPRLPDAIPPVGGPAMRRAARGSRKAAGSRFRSCAAPICRTRRAMAR